MSLLPIFLKLDGRNVLLVGAGHVALDKIRSLLPTGAKLRVVAPAALPEIERMAEEGRVEWVQREFEPADVEGFWLVIAATSLPNVNAEVHRAAEERGILSNSVDDIPNCDFFFASIVSRGSLQIAISTGGESPAFAQRLRREIDEQLPYEVGPWLEKLGQVRREILATHSPGEARKTLLHQLAQRPVGRLNNEGAVLGDRGKAKEIEGPGYRTRARQGHVYLTGAGPGDPDLLTVKAFRLIQTADVILHDDLVPSAILSMAAPGAEIVNVGKRCGVKTITQEQINALMILQARAGSAVVRLKSGDPLLFGRAAEEIGALTEAEVPFEIVPGVSAAFAAAAAIGSSLTDRGCASNVIFSTGHHAQSHNQAPLPAMEDATRVVYMPGRDLTLLSEEWLAEGLPPDFPCAIVSRAAQPDQQVLCSTLGALGEMRPAEAPSLLIAGWAVGNAVNTSALKSDLAVEAA
jgi:uroporphyrin-III C-methyltransferase/precorrin-2 dehydrogenase/sirohydrochlorin ferrochelatase